MELLLTTGILFIISIILPAFASQDEDDPRPTGAQGRRARAQAERQVAREALEALDATPENLQKIVELKQKELQLTIDLQKAEADLAQARGTFSIENARRIQEATDALEDFKEISSEALEDQANKARISDAAVQEIVESLGILTGVSREAGGSIVGSFAQAATSGEGLAATLKKVGKNLKETYTFTNIATSIFRKFTEQSVSLFSAQDEAISSFVRATGASRDYGQQITDVFMRNREFGVSVEEAGSAFEALFTGMASFTLQSTEAQQTLATQVALMGEFGISNEIAAESLDTMVRVLGMTATQAAETSDELANFAVSIGVPPARLMQELSATAPMLAQWGSQTTDVLMDLTEVSKATNIEMGSLIGIASQFDTFEGAAEAAGRLNSMLGGPFLNSVELLNANEADRIRLLQESLSLSGRSFSDMDRFTRMSIARTVGITDMTQAEAIFGGTLEQNIATLREREQAEREAEERAAEAQSIRDQYASLLQAFAVSFLPILEGVRDALPQITAAVGGISESITNFINTGFGQFLGSVIARFGPLALGIGLASSAMLSLLRPFRMITRLFGGSVGRIGRSAAAYGTETAAITANTAALRANNAARMGGGIGMGPGMGRGRRGGGGGVSAIPTGQGIRGRAARAGAGRTAARVGGGLALRGAGRAALGFLGPIGLGIGGALLAYDVFTLARGAISDTNDALNERRSPPITESLPALAGTAAAAAGNLQAVSSNIRGPGAGIGDAAAGLAMARAGNSTRAIEENTRSNREMVRAMEGVINRDIVLTMNGREFDRASRNSINRGVRIARENL